MKINRFFRLAIFALSLAVLTPVISYVVIGDPLPICPPFCGDPAPGQGGGGN